MQVKELKAVVFDKVVLYVSENNDYIDVYKGTVQDIPVSLLDKKVIVVGAKRKNILDIHIER